MGVRVGEFLRALTLTLGRATKSTTTTTTTTITLNFCVLVLVVSCVFMTPSSSAAEPPDGAVSEALLRFKNSLSNGASLLANWDLRASWPCEGNRANWVGVLCAGGHVRGLQLESMGLEGAADISSLATLPHFRTLSFMNNTLIGPIPDLKQLSRLRSVYLSYNHFSGEVPGDCFAGMRFLKKVLLSNNELEGKIPPSLAELPELEVLRADGNKFSGELPEFAQSLKRINVSNNDLEGPIPQGLSKMDLTAFSGNKFLCGPPLGACSSSNTNIFFYTNFGSTRDKSSPALKIAIIVLIIILIVAILVSAFIVARARRKTTFQVLERTNSASTTTTIAGRNNNTMSLLNRTNTANRGEPELNLGGEGGPNPKKPGDGKLSFLREDRRRFDLHDLLRASAEILGSGTFGSSYKATILCDSLVVKRYKQMNGLGRDEFHDHMRRLGRLNHANLLPLVAYYYRREEKLLVYDYVDNGSLAFHLHGNRNADQAALDWPTRLRIIKGITKGLAYLYTAMPSLVVPHGHLKSSNIVLDADFEPLMTDYALLPTINLDHAQHLMMAYKSPEHAKLSRITKRTDVWSLGIVILEVLTGRFPENYLARRFDPNADLATWCNEMIKERRTGQVFDADMGGACKGEMLKLLKIGLSCCEEDVERRLELSEVVTKIGELSHQGTELKTSNRVVDHGDFYPNTNLVNHGDEDDYISRAM